MKVLIIYSTLILSSCVYNNQIILRGKAIDTKDSASLDTKTQGYYLRGVSNWDDNIVNKKIIVKCDSVIFRKYDTPKTPSQHIPEQHLIINASYRKKFTFKWVKIQAYTVDTIN